MIDKLILRCRFKEDWLDFDLRRLNLPLEGSFDVDGKISALRHKWESIPSSHDGLGFKVFFSPENKINPDPYIEINASPAKLKQGHNIFGSDDLQDCSLVLMEVLFNHYPEVVDKLDLGSWEIAEMHITYFSRAKTEVEAEHFIRAIQNISRGQTKARTGYATTAYFGKKNTRIKSLRVYAKYPEVLHTLENLRKKKTNDQIREIYSDELIEWSKGMIRWESVLKKRWFQRKGISTSLIELAKIWNKELAEECWKDSLKDIFNALKGEKMIAIRDERLLDKLKKNLYTVNKKTGKISYAKAETTYRSYRLIKAAGFEEWKRITSSSSTRSRHIKDLQLIGISQAQLQQHKGDGIEGNVIPMIRYIEVNFEAQFPEFSKEVISG